MRVPPDGYHFPYPSVGLISLERPIEHRDPEVHVAKIHLRRTGRAGLALALIVLLTAWSAGIAVAASGPVAGNNGTVKIHEGPMSNEPQPEIRNEPHVCTFHMHFFFSDAFQSGDWWIDQQAPTGSDPAVLGGFYDADANGEVTTAEFGLPSGHYTLNWEGRDLQNIKHKTFWVTCENPPGEIVGSGGPG